MRWRELPAAVALVDVSATRGLVLETNDAAEEQHVRAGLSTAQALARSPGICLLPRSPAQEDACQELLLDITQGYSPRVESTAPGIATLDLRSASNVTCWQRLGESIARRLGSEQLLACVGFARNPDYALLAARTAQPVNVVYDGRPFCEQLQLDVLEPDENIASILHEWGIRTVGDFLKLPKVELIDRLGAEAARMWNRATGRGRRALNLLQPRETFSEAFDFEGGIETNQPLLFLLRRFLDSLCARMRGQHRVVESMRFRLPLDDGTNYERTFSVPAPTTDVDVLFRILDSHLESLQLDMQPVGIRLELSAADPQGRQMSLFERGIRDPNGLGFTLARLQAVVGEGRVGTPQPANTHRPWAFVLERFSDERPLEPIDRISFGFPLRRLRPGSAVRVRTHSGKPAWLDSSDWSGPVRNVSGPYRISGEWWDSSPWNVEEWDVELEGRGLLRLARHADGWTVEGTYDVR